MSDGTNWTRSALSELSLPRLRSTALRMDPNVDAARMNREQLVTYIWSRLRRRGRASPRRPRRHHTPLRRRTPPRRHTPPRKRTPPRQCRGPLEPLSAARRRLMRVGMPGAAPSDHEPYVVGAPDEIWDADALPGLARPVSHRIDHRLVSAPLMPSDCDIPDYEDSARADFRKRSFSPRPASLESILADRHIRNNSVPVVRLVTGDDRAALHQQRRQVPFFAASLVDDDDEAEALQYALVAPRYYY